jgi:L-lactate dehydrogenase complex protein LldE
VVAAVRLLRHLGVDVEFPEAQTCCGQPAFNAGYHVRRAGSPSTTSRCSRATTTWCSRPARARDGRRALPRPVRRRHGRAGAAAVDLAGRTVELTTFVTDVVGVRRRRRRPARHARHLPRRLPRAALAGVGEAPRRLLRAAGAELVEADGHDVCCGFGGLFAVKLPEVSAAMARAKHEGIRHRRGGAHLDRRRLPPAARRQPASRAGARGPRVVHVAELLWEGVASIRSRAGGG